MSGPNGAGRNFRQVLTVLFAIQFFSWSAMFALWLCAVPFVGGQVLQVDLGDAQGMQSVLTSVALCFAGYALLGAIGGLFLPNLIRLAGHAATYAGGLALGAVGLFLLSQAHGPMLLVPAFVAIGLGWCVTGSLPYALLGKLAPPGTGAAAMRWFAFSTVLPQAVTTLFYALFGAHWFGARLDLLLGLAAGEMALAALLAFSSRNLFAPADLVDEDW